MVYSQNFYYALGLGGIALLIIFILVLSLVKKPKKNYFDPQEIKPVKEKKVVVRKDKTNSSSPNVSTQPAYKPMTAPTRPQRKF